MAVRLLSSVLIASPALAAGDDQPTKAEACALLTRSLTVVEGRQRHDLSQPKDGRMPCERPDAEGCPYVVEVEYELIHAERSDLAARLFIAFGRPVECDDDLRFAMKHGLPAYRDMRVMVDAAIDEVMRLYGPQR